MPVPLIVLLAVLLGLGVLGFLRLHLEVSCGEQSHVSVRYAFVTVSLDRLVGGGAPAQKRGKKPGGGFRAADVRSFLRLFRQFAGWVRDTAAVLRRHLRIDRLSIHLVICEEDAAATAIRFGEACAAVYGGLGVIGALIPIRRRDISIRPLYNGSQGRVAAGGSLSIRLGALLWVALRQGAALIIRLVRRNKAASGQRKAA